MDRLECDRMFMAVVDTGSFTGAAERLGTSSGQASKLVSRLEATLSVRLLSRTTRSVVLTEAGRAYHERLKPLLEELEMLDREIRNISQSPRGLLRLTAPQSFGALDLAPALNAFALRYREIDLDVSFTDRVMNLVEDGFDLAVRVGRPDESRLVARKLCEVPILVVGAPTYLERHGEPMSPASLADHACIIDANFREPGRWHFLEGGVDRAVPVRGRLRFSNAEACLRAAEDGLGLACVPAFVAADALRSGRVRRLLRAFEPSPYAVHALYPHGRHLATKVRVCVDFLVEHYRGRRPWEAD